MIDPLILRSLIVLAIGGGLLLMAVRSLRAQRLKERYAVLFALLGVPFLILAIWRDGVGQLALWLDIDYRTFALLIVTVFVVVMNFKLLSIVSVQDRRLTTLAQTVALLRHEISSRRNTER